MPNPSGESGVLSRRATPSPRAAHATAGRCAAPRGCARWPRETPCGPRAAGRRSRRACRDGSGRRPPSRPRRGARARGGSPAARARYPDFAAAHTFDVGMAASCGRASERCPRFTIASVRSRRTSGAMRARVVSRSERSPTMRQYCLGMGAPAINRVSAWSRVPSPPASTRAQRRSAAGVSIRRFRCGDGRGRFGRPAERARGPSAS